jgi:tRNA dimethylallyltransferase
LVIVGPTGVGKTSLSLEIAFNFGAEIISADSRLFYRGMDIGTDKPSLVERQQIPHHLIDICSPDETVSLGQFKRLAMEAINEIHGRDRVPILVGGTGQYVKAVVEGWTIPGVAPNYLLREALLKIGQPEIDHWLQVLDSVSSERIDPRNTRRVVRALEITLVKGVPVSTLQRKIPPDFDIKTVGLACKREILYQRVDDRVDRMMEGGLLGEVMGLKRQGYEGNLSSMSGLGYRQLLAYLDGETTLDEAVERIKFETHRFIRQQSNWFRLDDKAITWLDVASPVWKEMAVSHVQEWLGASNPR